jgi:two-component system aerobic respiration control sensor histidine kinase ArcB
MTRKGALLLLKSLDCKVDVATCGEEAINLFKPGQYVLVLMDVGLPDMTGFEVAKKLKKMENGTSFSVPILGLSAHAAEQERRLGKAAGMIQTLSKPLLFDQLKAILVACAVFARHEQY